MLAAFYVPVPAYVLWINFQRFSGPRSVLLIPVFISIGAGYLDRSRGPFRVALWLVVATYCVIAFDTIRECSTGGLTWLWAPVVLVGAAVWSGVVIGIPTLLCTLAGASARARLGPP